MDAAAETLKQIYYDIANPASYSTAEKLYIAADKKIPLEQVKEWLSGQLAYTLHRPRRVNFKRNFYNLDNINDQLQADLMDLDSLKDDNDGFRYVLLVIDAFSRYVRVRPLKTKTAREVLTAFKEIIGELEYPPLNIVTDHGGEFFNKSFESYCKSKGIKHYAPGSDTFKAAIAERAIRTFKGIMFKALTARLSYRYIDILQDVAKSMNARKNRSINRAPIEVTPNNVFEVWAFVQEQRRKEKSRHEKHLLKPGDFVRVSKNKNSMMDKGFLPNYTDEIFKIIQRIPKKPRPIYKLEDYKGEKIKEGWYKEELQKVMKNEETLYRVDKVLRKRKRRGIKEVLVSWKGYSEKHNSWIPETDLTRNE